MPWDLPLSQPKQAFSDLEATFRIRILRTIVQVVPWLFLIWIVFRVLERPFSFIEWIAALSMLALATVSAVLVRFYGKLRLGAYALLLTLWLSSLLSALLFDGIASAGIIINVILPVLSAVTVGNRYSKMVFFVAASSFLFIGILAKAGGLPVPDITNGKYIVSFTFSSILLTFLSYWLTRIYEIARLERESRLVQISRLIDVGVLAAGISHEINNPMAVILNSAKLIELQNKRAELDRSSVERLIRQIEKSAHQVSSITHVLTRYSEKESGSANARYVPDDIVRDALTLCRQRFEMAGIQIKLSLNANHIQVAGDGSELARAIVSLLNNSYDAIVGMSANGEVEAQEKWIRIITQSVDHSVELRVIDSGDGIPAELKQYLFMPFFTTKPPGKGIGLALVHGAIALRQQKGELRFDDKAQNTTFVISLPIPQASLP